MSSRLKKLETLAGDVENACHVCGYPANAVWVAIYDSPDRVRTCEQCGRHISPDGDPCHAEARCVVFAGVADAENPPPGP